MSSISYTPAGVVAQEFHKSEAFVRGLMGPVGSSKSSACCMEIFSRGIEQRAYQGVRRTRWAVIRATYPELKSTTIRTWQEWFPQELAPMKFDAPISSMFKRKLEDGTIAEIEVLFFPVESPQEIEKLSSLEITGAWINEARELPIEVLNKLTERVGRFPKTIWGGDQSCNHEASVYEMKCRKCGAEKLSSPTWRGVLMDTNPPDDDGWWYGLAEGSSPEMVQQMAEIEAKMRSLGYLKEGQRLYEFFKQPGGLIEINGKLEPNPRAENVSNLDGGYAYYYRQAAGKKKNWIKAQVLGQYATYSSGRGVYEDDYNDDIHCREIEPIRDLPIIIGQDYGRTPAAALCQITKNGQFRIIDEVVAEGMGIRVFARDLLKPHLAQYYKDFQIVVVGDPAGLDGRDTEETTCFQILAEEGFAAVPALSNEQNARIEALSYYMNQMGGGEPKFLISPKAAKTRKGLNGGYCYDRIQVSGDRYRDVPSKNKYSHPVEGAQYAALHTKNINVNAAWDKKIEYRAKEFV